jgi:hypothetical protein
MQETKSEMAGYAGHESAIDLHAQPYSAERTQEIVEQFHRDGYYFFGPILTPAEIAALQAAMERKHADPALHDDEEGDYIRGISLLRMFEYDCNFRDLVMREPIVSLVEAILGPDCHVMSQNALRNEPGQGVTSWHADDRVFFPLPDEVARHDPRIQVPCFVINVLIALTDVDSMEYGPTQVVPGSHYSGRGPTAPENPEFEGKGPVSLLSKAGDAYMFHNQVWHRGAPNTSDRVRFLGGMTYSQRVIAQRFYPFIDYHMPDHVRAGVDERMLRLLGKHQKGAYG